MSGVSPNDFRAKYRQELVRAAHALEGRDRTRRRAVQGSKLVGAVSLVTLAAVMWVSVVRDGGSEPQISASGGTPDVTSIDGAEDDSEADGQPLPEEPAQVLATRQLETDLVELIKPPVIAIGTSVLTVGRSNGIGEIVVESTSTVDGSTTLFQTGMRGRNNPAVVWTGDRLLVAGGQLAEAESEPFGLVIDPVSLETEVIDGPPERLTTFSLARDRGVWVAGELIFWQDGAAYDLASATWRVVPPPPFAEHRDFASSVVIGDKVVVFGGCARDESTDPEYSSNCMETGAAPRSTGAIYDPLTDEWTLVPSAPSAAGGPRHEAVAVGNELLVLNLEVEPPHLHAYDLAAEQWNELTGPPLRPRVHSAIEAAGETVVVWGGLLLRDVLDPNPGGTQPTRDSLVDGAVYDASTGAWTPITLPQGLQRSHHSIAVVEQSTAFVSGSYQNNVPFLFDLP